MPVPVPATYVTQPVPVGPSGPPAAQMLLNAAFEGQLQTKWCWAAVAVAVHRSYGSAGAWSQCSLVEGLMFPDGFCTCNGRENEQCNVKGSLSAALRHVGNFTRCDAAPSAGALIGQLSAGVLTPVGITWHYGGKLHFVMIYGYFTSGANTVLQLSDPWYGVSRASLTEFPNGYQGGAAWTYSYTTHP